MNGQRRFFLMALLALVCQLPWSGAKAQTVEYIHTDALGTPIAVTDANRVVIERSEYEPYGKLLNRPLTDGPGFTGHVQDAATGLTYMQQRYYDPMIGRFLSVDPVTANSGTGANFNRYWYANNSSYRFTDPDGRQSWSNTGTANSWPAVQQACGDSNSCEQKVAGDLAKAEAKIAYTAYGGATVPGLLRAIAAAFIRQEAKSEQPNPSPGNSNPYDGPVDSPVTVVDSDGNAIPVGSGEQITSSPDGRYQQVRDSNGSPTGTRLDKGGHRTHADPKAQGPHGHRPGVTDSQGNPHLPLNEPKPQPPPEPKL